MCIPTVCTRRPGRRRVGRFRRWHHPRRLLERADSVYSRVASRRDSEDYEANTGHVIVETFKDREPLEVPSVLVASHGPFCWGATVEKAVENSAVLEFVAQLAERSLQLHSRLPEMPGTLLKKHFFRKHGAGAYYGQRRSK